MSLIANIDSYSAAVCLDRAQLLEPVHCFVGLGRIFSRGKCHTTSGSMLETSDLHRICNQRLQLQPEAADLATALLEESQSLGSRHPAELPIAQLAPTLSPTTPSVASSADLGTSNIGRPPCVGRTVSVTWDESCRAGKTQKRAAPQRSSMSPRGCWKPGQCRPTRARKSRHSILSWRCRISC